MVARMIESGFDQCRAHASSSQTLTLSGPSAPWSLPRGPLRLESFLAGPPAGFSRRSLEPVPRSSPTTDAKSIAMWPLAMRSTRRPLIVRLRDPGPSHDTGVSRAMQRLASPPSAPQRVSPLRRWSNGVPLDTFPANLRATSTTETLSAKLPGVCPKVSGASSPPRPEVVPSTATPHAGHGRHERGRSRAYAMAAGTGHRCTHCFDNNWLSKHLTCPRPSP